MSAKAVLLLSGGLDSTTMLALALKEGFAVHALTFSYGQRHAAELSAARSAARRYGLHMADHKVVEMDLRIFGGSALTADIPVPKVHSSSSSSDGSSSGGFDGSAASDGSGGGGIPVTYVPARNTIFLSYALAYAEVIGARDIFIGVNSVDYSGYPDCRPEYIEAFEKMANLATKAGVEGARIKIHTPLIKLSKKQIISLGTLLDVDYSMTLSCYDPTDDAQPCGHCDACRLRLKGFQEAGIPDPARYQGMA